MKKIQKSIDNQKYIITFMQACGYSKDGDVNDFLQWLPQQQGYTGITYDILRKAFDDHIKDMEKQKNPKQTVNNISMNELYKKQNIPQIINYQKNTTLHDNIVHGGLNSQLLKDTNDNNTQEAKIFFMWISQ